MSRTLITVLVLALGGATIAAILPPAAAWYSRYRHRANRAYPSGFGLQNWTHLAMLIHTGLVILILLDLSPLGFLPFSSGLAYLEGTARTVIVTGGLLLFAAGNGMRVWAAYAMGETFDKAVLVRESHRVITTGPYRWSRHPMYAGNLLAELGLGVTVMSWPLVLFTLVISFPLNNHRAASEEELLEEHLGRDYRVYRRRVGRWFI